MGKNDLPRPIVKWAGGKTQIQDILFANSPKHFAAYHEPFLGGGAFFFHLYRKGLIKKAYLSDSNSDLISLYKVLREDVEPLIDELESGKYLNQKEVYYQIRDDFNKAKSHEGDQTEQAARLIFLNRTCYNGLYRVNSKGEFNVPFGRYKNPTILDEANLQSISVALQAAELLNVDFETSLSKAKKNDFVYLDPPYVPINTTSDFTAYTRAGFGVEDQKRLAQVFGNLNSRKCLLLASNSATPLISNLYKDFIIQEILAARAISCNGSTRGKIAELLIRNYNDIRQPSPKQTKLME